MERAGATLPHLGDDGVQPVIVEVNPGPALEALAWPELCHEVVEDVCGVVADAWPVGAAVRDETATASSAFTPVAGAELLASWPSGRFLERVASMRAAAAREAMGDDDGDGVSEGGGYDG